MKFSRSLCILLLACAAAGSAGATSCADNSSFRQLVQEAREETAVRVARVRVVPRMTFFTIVPNLTLPPDDPIFEVLEFLDDRSSEGTGTQFSENGVVNYLLDVPSAGRTKPLPMGSEWILRVRDQGTMHSRGCGAIFEVRNNAVQGLVQNLAGTPPEWQSQALPLADFRRAPKASADRKP